MVTQESAVERHDRMVREEREQAERIRSDLPEEDLWRPHARRFGAGSDEGRHPAVDALLTLIELEWRLVDVGAGGGRITVELARVASEVVAVEPSPSMRAQLIASARAAGVSNLTVVPSMWETAEVEAAEMVMAANVTYGVHRIEPFLRKMNATATRRAVLVVFADPPQQRIAPFWEFVHGEKRLRLPCRAELLAVLHELGASPQVIALPAHEPRSFGTREQAHRELRRRLFVGPGTDADERIGAAIDHLLEERDGELWLPIEARNERSVVWWTPGELL